MSSMNGCAGELMRRFSARFSAFAKLCAVTRWPFERRYVFLSRKVYTSPLREIRGKP